MNGNIDFGTELAALLQRYQRESLFRKPPPVGPVEESVQRLRDGRYLMRPCGVEFRTDVCGSLALELLKHLRLHFPQSDNALTEIEDAFVSEQANLLKFLEYVFANQDQDVLQFIDDLGLDRAWAVIFAVYLARPYRASMAEKLTQNLDLSVWKQGYCPVCGHWPSLSLLAATDDRRLWCLQCGTIWSLNPQHCPFCRSTDPKDQETVVWEKTEYIAAKTCRRCRRYVRQIPWPSDAFPGFLDLMSLASAPLDEIAHKNGFRKEPVIVTRYSKPEGNELLMYRQERSSCNGKSRRKQV